MPSLTMGSPIASEEKDVCVVIIGAGPAGLATAASLNYANVPNIVLEKDNVCAPLWKRRAYDRLKLHLAKEFCSLPHMSLPWKLPKYVPRAAFVSYLDTYASHFHVDPLYNRTVLSASYDEAAARWRVEARNTTTVVEVDDHHGPLLETYLARYLVVATGQNCEGIIPDVPGLEGFSGEWMHSSEYQNGLGLTGKNVLVVGCGNSGMEISYDLSNYDAKASIVVRHPVHVLTTGIVYIGMKMLKFLPTSMVDKVVVFLSRLKYGRVAKKHGIRRPDEGPFFLKEKTGKTPTIDVGVMRMIKMGKIKVRPGLTRIEGDTIEFEDGKKARFDAIIFATGYRSTVRKWLKGGEDVFNANGMPVVGFSKGWKGDHGLYCAGFSQMGLAGISKDAMNIANDIILSLSPLK
ncbi:hypothetical protein SAY87_022282 [Trapa incisa]|uniref:Flavin-containing monooxygenase n=1 Tax=Trapa incisa TaxID=236973 RepID=A0AAN7Q3W3_9MYRT|nr:hypothetical protein SAY87_022282 [Trapa incisa]